MRFQSGITDQVIFFVAVDSTDYVTREVGLSSFTVYRARDTGSATAFTTPTVTEVDATNMPGVYKLLLDEDMTIGAGNDSEAVVLHITQASMAPVTIMYELYRPVATSASIAALNDLSASDVWAAAVDGATTAAESLRLSNSALGGKLSGAGTGTETVRDLADSKDRLTYTVDTDGNRSAVTRDLT